MDSGLQIIIDFFILDIVVQWRDGLLNFISLLFFNQNFFSTHNLFRLLPLRVSVNCEKGYDTLLAGWKNVRIFKVNLQARDGAVMCLHFVNFLNKWTFNAVAQHLDATRAVSRSARYKEWPLLPNKDLTVESAFFIPLLSRFVFFVRYSDLSDWLVRASRVNDWYLWPVRPEHSDWVEIDAFIFVLDQWIVTSSLIVNFFDRIAWASLFTEQVEHHYSTVPWWSGEACVIFKPSNLSYWARGNEAELRGWLGCVEFVDQDLGSRLARKILATVRKFNDFASFDA